MYHKVSKRFKWEKKFDVVFYGKTNGHLRHFIPHLLKTIPCAELSH